MWTSPKKWQPSSVEARIYAQAEADALAAGEAAPGEVAAEAVYQVMGWLCGSGYAAVVEMIKEQWGVETSVSALAGFWQRFSSAWHLERMRRSSAAAQAMADSLDVEAVTKSTLDLIAQQAFEILSQPAPDPGAVARLVKVLLVHQKQSLEERKVALLEAKAKRLEELEEKAKTLVRGGGLSPETLAVLETQLKLL